MTNRTGNPTYDKLIPALKKAVEQFDYLQKKLEKRKNNFIAFKNLARLLYVKKSTIEGGEDSGGSAAPATPPPNKKN